MKARVRLHCFNQVCSQAKGIKARIGDLHMCAPDSIRSTRCLLRGCPDGGHANDQLKFPDRSAKIQSETVTLSDLE